MILAARARAALDLLAGLAEVQDQQEFTRRLLEHGCGLLRADRASLTEISTVGVTGYGWPCPPEPRLRAILDQRYAEHPAVIALRRSPDSCFRLREELSLRQLRKMSIYRDFMQPLGCDDQIAIALRARDRLVSLAVARVDGRFAVGDQDLLDRMAGPLRHLYAAARAREVSTQMLTPRESEILRLVADGHTDKAIATRLGISQRTIEKHLEAVRAKVGVGSRCAAVARWLGW